MAHILPMPPPQWIRKGHASASSTYFAMDYSLQHQQQCKENWCFVEQIRDEFKKIDTNQFGLKLIG